MKSPRNFLLLVSFIFLSIAIISSCKKDVEGCSDPTADNYNPDANKPGECIYSGCTDPDAVNFNPKANKDDGKCEYARDAFIGTYLGKLACPILTAANSDSLVFSIEERSSGKNDVRLLITLAGLPFILEGTVGNNGELTVAADLKKVPYTVLGLPTEVDILASGKATLDSTKKNISGTITVNLKLSATGLPLASDTCNITGVKK